jgi:hypothetical protein
VRGSSIWAGFGALLALLLQTGCESTTIGTPAVAVAPSSDLERSAAYNGPDRNPVIVVPGFMGSRLTNREDGQLIWDGYNRTVMNPSSARGAQELSFQINSDKPIRKMTDLVVADGVLDKPEIGLAGLPPELQAHVRVMSVLQAGGYREQALLNTEESARGAFTCFQFPYDWRQDNIHNAKLLDEFIREKREYLQREYKDRYGVDVPDLKFDIVTIGSGALLTRYFLRYGGTDVSITGRLPIVTWAGVRSVGRVILIAPPNGGYFQIFAGLLNGLNAGALGEIPAAVLGTMPGAYQLLPRSRHRSYYLQGDTQQPVTDILDAKLWQRMEWGLVSPAHEGMLARVLPDQPDYVQRLALALEHQKKCLERAKYFQEALDQEARTPLDLELRVVVGTDVPTIAAVAADRRGHIEVLEVLPGDGLTTRGNALLDERRADRWEPHLKSSIKWNQVSFTNQSLQQIAASPMFSRNLLYWLMEEPRS